MAFLTLERTLAQDEVASWSCTWEPVRRNWDFVAVTATQVLSDPTGYAYNIRAVRAEPGQTFGFSSGGYRGEITAVGILEGSRHVSSSTRRAFLPLRIRFALAFWGVMPECTWKVGETEVRPRPRPTSQVRRVRVTGFQGDVAAEASSFVAVGLNQTYETYADGTFAALLVPPWEYHGGRKWARGPDGEVYESSGWEPLQVFQETSGLWRFGFEEAAGRGFPALYLLQW